MIPHIQPAFSAGEIAPNLFGRVDLAKFHTGASTLRNMFVDYRGGAVSRAGTHFVGQCKQLGSAAPPRLIRYQFNIKQGYILEFGQNYLRFVAAGAYITETPIAITGISNANPAVVSISGQPFNNNDWIILNNVLGMTQVNDQTYIVTNPTPGSFSLTDLFGVPVNSTNFGVYTGGGTAARIYTLQTPYQAVDLPLLKYVQSADSMSLTNSNYPPYDLRRIQNALWTLTQTSFAAPIAAPTGASGTTSQTIGGFSSTQYQYVVTAVDPVTGGQSVASNIATISNSVDIAAQAGSITIGWNPVPGASSYNIYKAPAAIGGTGSSGVPIGSLFGYAGTALGTQFVDQNITQDFTTVPPVHENPFAISTVIGVSTSNAGINYTQSTASAVITSSAGTSASIVPVIVGGNVVAFLIQQGGQLYANGDPVTVSGGTGSGFVGTAIVGPSTGTYPGVVNYFEERRVYANTPNQPDTYFMSQPEQFTNFDSAIPIAPNDAITGSPWSLQVNGIQFLVPMPSTFGSALIVMTGLQAWQLTGGSGGQPFSAINQVAVSQAFSGCSSTVNPLVIYYHVLYVPARGSAVRDLSYNFFANIYTGTDMTVLSNHLFNGHQIIQWDWAEEPFKLVWAVRDDGVLLSFTYLQEQDVYAWARHDTG